MGPGGPHKRACRRGRSRRAREGRTKASSGNVPDGNRTCQPGGSAANRCGCADGRVAPAPPGARPFIRPPDMPRTPARTAFPVRLRVDGHGARALHWHRSGNAPRSHECEPRTPAPFDPSTAHRHGVGERGFLFGILLIRPSDVRSAARPSDRLLCRRRRFGGGSCRDGSGMAGSLPLLRRRSGRIVRFVAGGAPQRHALSTAPSPPARSPETKPDSIPTLCRAARLARVTCTHVPAQDRYPLPPPDGRAALRGGSAFWLKARYSRTIGVWRRPASQKSGPLRWKPNDS